MRKPPFLRKKSDGYVYPYTDVLAKRTDMVPHDPSSSPAKGGAEAAAPVSPEYADMHWKQLKRLVEEAGMPWVDKDTAVKFLRGEA